MKKVFAVLLGVLVLVPALAQGTIQIKGTILDAATGEPVIGASVKQAGTAVGTISDLDGNFSISIPSGARLDYSSIGYEDQSVTYRESHDAVKIKLKPSAEFLEEVVVVGYGSVKKENLSGAVDQVSSEVFEGRPTANATQMLQGAVPNLNISLENGKPGQTSDLNIRGMTSIGGGGSALVLIDGVEGELNMLNPNDIESVSVLKDASSAAIYGSRASYGVVLITTKDPSKNKDKFNITYSANFAMMQPTNIPDIVDDGYVYAKYFYTAWQNYNHTQPTGINKSQDFSLTWLDDFRLRKKDGITRQTAIDEDGKYIYYGNTNYYDLLYRDNVFAQTHNISVSGASQKMSYYVSGRLYDYGGLLNFDPDAYRTMNLRGKIKAQLTPWLEMTENLSYDYDKYHIPSGSTTESKGNFYSALDNEGHPCSPLFNPDGTMTLSGAYAIGGLVNGNNYLDRVTKTFKTTTALKASFFKNTLHLNADFSYMSRDKNEVDKKTAVPYSTHVGVIEYLGTPFDDDRLREYFSNQSYLAANAYVDYENTWGKHYFKGLIGYNYEQKTLKGVTATRYGLITPNVEALNLAIGEQITTSSSGSRWRVAGGFFRLNYSFGDRYLIEVDGRYDGSSKFPTNSQWGFFPSVSAAWRISQEPWWKVDPMYMSNLKLRGSYGSLGNGNVAAYSYLEKFSMSNQGRILDGVKNRRETGVPSQIPDNLTWETSNTIDGGLDIGFYHGKINLTGDYYVRKTLNMFTVGPTLPDTYGANAPKGNYADMSTYGWELSLSYNDSFNVAGKPFNFGVKASVYDYYSIIDRYNNPTRSLDDYYAGQRLGDMWGYVCYGLFQTQDEIDNCYGPGIPYVNTKIRTSVDYGTYPGDMKFEDLNGNRIIDSGANTVDSPGDKIIIGNNKPRYQYSFNFNFEWNGIYASAFFQGVGKQDWYPSAEAAIWGQYIRPYHNLPKWQLGKMWTEDNRDAWLPRLTGYYRPFYTGTKNNRYLLDVSYLRLKNVQVGYNFPQKWMKAAKMQGLSIYLSMENVYTWSPLYDITTDYDVTTAMNGADSDINADAGDGYNYPTMRSISLGLTIKF